MSRAHLALPLILAAGLLAGCGGDSGPQATAGGVKTGGGAAENPDIGGAKPQKTASTVVKMKDIAFKPKKVTVKAGDTIEWKNTDSVVHNVTADSGADFKSDPQLEQGETFKAKVDKPGIIKYECTIHPGMTGEIVVKK